VAVACLPTFANVQVDGFPNVADAGVVDVLLASLLLLVFLAVTDVPFVVVFPYVPDVYILLTTSNLLLLCCCRLSC
jgi:hypothetical protein